MSFLTRLSDVQKGNPKQVRINLQLQHQNKQGIFKSSGRDSLTCWGNQCSVCYECTTGGCYQCGTDIWECECDFGNIRKEPDLMDMHFEDFFEIVKNHFF